MKVTWFWRGTCLAGVAIRYIKTMRPAVVPVTVIFFGVGVWSIHFLAAIETLWMLLLLVVLTLSWLIGLLTRWVIDVTTSTAISSIATSAMPSTT